MKKVFKTMAFTLLGLVLSSNLMAASATYTKVTSAPTDWSGDYILVYETDGAARVFTGVDAASDFEEATISNNTITGEFVTLTLGTTDGGYLVKINGGDNDGKYISSSANSNGLAFGTSGAVMTMSYDESVLMTNAGGAVMRYNSASNQDRFRFYKSTSYANQQPVQLYKAGSTPTPPAGPSLSVSSETIDFGEVYKDATVDAEQVTVTFANLTTNDVAAAITGSAFSINKTGSFTSGDKITITPSTANLGEYEETLTVSAATDDLEKTVTVTMNVVAAPAPFEGKKLTFDLSTNNLNLPTAKGSSVAGDYTYTLDDVNYTFSVTDAQGSSDGGVYFSSSYTMVYASNAIGLPAISGYKLVKVEASNSSGCSTSVNVAIKEGPTADDNDVTGGTAQTWSTTSSTYTYNLSGTDENTMYYLYVSSNKNAQITSLTLYYQELPKVYSAITLAECTYGSVKVTGADDLTSVASGTEITLGNTPDAGYTLNEYDVYKTGEPATKVTITDGKFKMPAYAVTVSATFKSARTLTGIDINTDNVKKEYWVGDTFTSEGLVVTAHFDGAADEEVTPTSITGHDMATAGDQTITVSFTEGATTKSDEYTIKVKTIANTEETAYTVAEAIALIDANPAGLATANVYVKGTVSQVDNFNSKYSSITYWLNDNAFEVYSGKGLNNTGFTSIDDVVVGAEVIVVGKIKKFVKSGSPDVYEFDMNNYLVSYVAPENPKTTATITLGTYKTSLSADDAANEVTITYNGNGELSATSSNTDAATATIVEGQLVVTPLAAGSTTITVSASETEDYTAASKSYNLTVTAGLTAAALPFNFNGGKNDINPANGIKAEGLDDDYSSSPKLKFNGAGDYVLVKIASKAVQLSYSIKGAPGSGDWSGQFDVLESADGTAYTTVASHTELETSAETMTHDLLEGTRYIKFVLTTKSNGNVGLGAINIVATKPKTDPEFTIANVDVVVEDMAALQITTNSDGAVTYTIEPNNEGIEIENDVVYAYTEGTYTVTANKAETETYNAAQTTFTVSVSSVAYKTAEVSTFTAVNGGLLELGQFHSYKGGANNAPVINNNHIRLYQNGGYITISVLPGLTIAKIDISTATATSYNYKLNDSEDFVETENIAIAKDATANLVSLNANSVSIYNMGTTSSTRFDVSYLKVYYTGELETVSALAVAGAEVTEYEINDEVDHTGAVVTATFETAGDVDVTLNSTFTDPDMSTPGTKQVTANFAEQTATYDITVAAETPEITVDVASVTFGTVAQNAVVDAKTVAVTLKAIAEATVAVTGEGASAFNVTPASMTESGNITITPITTTAGEFTATITISADGAESKTIELSLTVAEATTYTLVTDVKQLAAGDIVVFGSTYTGGTDASKKGSFVNGVLGDNKYLASVSATIDEEKLTATGACEFTLAGGEGSWMLTSSEGQLGATAVKANLTTKTTAENYVGTWTIAIDETTYNATIKSTNENYGSMSYNGSSPRFANYSSVQNAIQLYKKEQTSEVVRTGLTSGKYGTICLNKEVTDFEGAEFYSIVGYQGAQDNPTGIVIESVVDGLEAGVPYIFLATATQITVTYTGEAVEEAGSDNGLIGSFEKEELANGYYGIQSNAIAKVVSEGVFVGANRAYIDMSEMSSAENAPAPAPGAHRVAMSNSSYSAPTNFNGLNGNMKAQKVMKDGQFYIIREAKMYNAQGIEVQ